MTEYFNEFNHVCVYFQQTDMFNLQQDEKKAKTEGKQCHTITMKSKENR